MKREILENLILRSVNYFITHMNKDEDYLLTQELLKHKSSLTEEHIDELKDYLVRENYYGLDNDRLWQGTISTYVNSLQGGNISYIDILLPVLLSWQRRRFANEDFIEKYERNFQSFIDKWKTPINNIMNNNNLLRNIFSFDEIPNLSFFRRVFSEFNQELQKSHRNNINEPVMIAKILHFLRPNIFIPFDNPIMRLLGLPVNEEGFSALNIWVYEFRIRNIIFVTYLENIAVTYFKNTTFKYSFPRLLDMVLWCGANNIIEEPVWKKNFEILVNYMLDIT